MRPGRRDALILGAVGLGAAAIGGVVGALGWQARSGAADLLASSFPDVSGRPQRLVQWQGRALLCNFWATWCAPCREEMPLLDAAARQYHTSGLQVAGIAVDQTANVAQFLENTRISYPILVAGAAGVELMRRLGNSAGGLPFTVLLDRHGRLAGHKLGAYDPQELEGALAGLLQ
jgi:thiol-disulfide isomerase/thioredoxin